MMEKGRVLVKREFFIDSLGGGGKCGPISYFILPKIVVQNTGGWRQFVAKLAMHLFAGSTKVEEKKFPDVPLSFR